MYERDADGITEGPLVVVAGLIQDMQFVCKRIPHYQRRAAATIEIDRIPAAKSLHLSGQLRAGHTNG